LETEATAEERSGTLSASHAVYGAAILCSAFLLFLVQPMVGKRVIPLFGGAPGVWTVCLAFYQTVLFLGYGYAHLLIRFASAPIQLALHALLLLGAAAVALALPDASFAVEGTDRPAVEVLRLLTAHVGLPFFVLASTGPLVQAWFARRHPTRSPYPLYALSNVGSFVALFAYPFVVEPRLGLFETMASWSFGFVAAGALLLTCAALAARRLDRSTSQSAATTGREVTAIHRLMWLLLSGTAVVVMMSLTNHLCRDIASVPFLWILPLAAYLATFIVSFSFERAYHRAFAVCVVIASMSLGAAQIFFWAASGASSDPSSADVLASLPLEIARISVLVFGVCWILHGELHAIRPRSGDLTLYYLLISAGGALGGLFVGIAAPALFTGHAELAVAAVLSLALVFAAIAHARMQTETTESVKPPGTWRSRLSRAAVWTLVALLAAQEVWFAVNPDSRQIHQGRNFFGVLRVLESGEGAGRHHMLMHGTTMHGVQFQEGRAKQVPTSYYGRGSPLAAAISMKPRDRPLRAGVVGLGVGTVAAYGRAGDLVRFYEIDPAVAEVASDETWFTFLSQSSADIEVEVGDARLLLEREQREGVRQDFDMLLVDAFSSDAVPVHLMTNEGFDPYLAALSDDGILIVHLSSRHFELGPVVARIAAEKRLPHLLVTSAKLPKYQTQAADWAIITREPKRINDFRNAAARLLERIDMPRNTYQLRRLTPDELASVPLWTDDYSDLFGALR